MMKLKRDQKGFTLIEVLLIVVILGIIAAIAIPRLMATKRDARVNSCHSSVASLNAAIEKYYYDAAAYGTIAQLVTGVDQNNDGTADTYLPDGAPTCPKTGGAITIGATNRGICSIHGDINGNDALGAATLPSAW